ncbi:hypothetical protein [Phenylobacterium deserti]|uniref:HEAT repeat domain-containing protein n=1 Tax=Phenylobacterium deserti TaxID=1914756 RepID=A0A328AA33_9CAUL|nr:hypothetical protein [Phenylobacterium deserti]RAK51522.1 hypothetical protein DJ018_16460 [Phenylobacterium deserti]
MLRFPALAAVLLLTAAPAAALAQAVEVAPLAAPDAFSIAGRQTGLPATVWQGASIDTVGKVLPLLASKPLPPAAAALARRVLATGAPGPRGIGADAGLTAARAQALTAVGDPGAAAAILARAPGVDRSAELSRAAAESALLAGDDARACAIGQALTVGREDVYWLRLRAFCQATAGETAQAQLTFDLAHSTSRDAVYGRLMSAKLAGAGSPGAASLRNGLDLALSRSLGLDLSAAKPAPAVAAALAAAEPTELTWTIPDGEDDVLAAARALASGGAVPVELLQRLLDNAAKADVKTRARAEGAALLASAFAAGDSADVRGRLAALTTPEGKTPIGRNLALEAAARNRLMGESAMLALWAAADAGTGGVAIADRARIVRALHESGLEADARAFAIEGLLALK